MSYSFSPRLKKSLPVFFVLLLTFYSQMNASEKIQIQVDKPISFQIDYKAASSELCWIGALYDTDKSSQRRNVSYSRHSHPYTLFYDALFKDNRDKDLIIAEVGTLYGASLLMWRDYFTNATIYGFEYNIDYINHFKQSFNSDRISLAEIDVHDPANIKRAFHATGVKYDLIIDDSTHEFEDQLRIIENVHSYLKPGGVLIIEDIFKRYNEQDYINRLKPVLDHFQDYYFVSLDHKNRCSIGWDNDKLFVLVKAGGNPIFEKKKKMTMITPCTSPSNLMKIKDSIDFDYVNEWIIVYDGSKVPGNPKLFIENPKINEYIYTGEGAGGNPERNFALDRIQNEDTFLYFLDEDKSIHKDLYKLLNVVDSGKIYTFNQTNGTKGDAIEVGPIDAGMFLIDFKLCKTTRWAVSEYGADLSYIRECYSKNKAKWIYVNNDLCN